MDQYDASIFSIGSKGTRETPVWVVNSQVLVVVHGSNQSSNPKTSRPRTPYLFEKMIPVFRMTLNWVRVAHWALLHLSYHLQGGTCLGRCVGWSNWLVLRAILPARRFIRPYFSRGLVDTDIPQAFGCSFGRIGSMGSGSKSIIYHHAL